MIPGVVAEQPLDEPEHAHELLVERSGIMAKPRYSTISPVALCR